MVIWNFWNVNFGNDLERQMKCWFMNWNWNWIWFGFEIYKQPIGVIITKVIKETGIGYGYTLYLNRKPL